MSDWDSVTVIRKRPESNKAVRSESAVNSALRAGGAIETEKKLSAANKEHSSTSTEHAHIAKIDRETDIVVPPKVTMDVGRAIQKARLDLKMTQKDLAQKINEKPAVITDYESGKGIPNQQVLGKLERVLGVKLRGKNIGEKF